MRRRATGWRRPATAASARAGSLATALMVGVAAWATSGSLGAQEVPADPAPPVVAAANADAAAAWEQARGLYAAQLFEDAIPFAIEAIQANPQEPTYYVGLARLYFQTASYGRALVYYDLYLNDLVPAMTGPIDERYDPVRVAAERAAAAQQPSEGPAFASQDAIRRSFDTRMASGMVLSATGGGAWSDYQALLRSGYARPDLTDLRSELRSALLAEAEEVVPPDAGQLATLTSEQWEAQCSRLSNAIALLDFVAGTVPAQASMQAQHALCRGQRQFLNLNYELAADEFRAAIGQLPDYVPAHMGLLNSLYQLSWNGELSSDEWVGVVGSLEALLAEDGDDLNVSEIYRAAFESQSGSIDDAVVRIGAILGIPAD